MRALTMGVAGGLTAAFGVGMAVVWEIFATLYVPECPTFALTAGNPHCRDPLFFIYGGIALAVVGAGMVLVAVGRVLGSRM